MPAVYVCPDTKSPLTLSSDGLVRSDGKLIPFLPVRSAGNTIPYFLADSELSAAELAALSEYNSAASTETYRNFLDWLFATFGADETAIRELMTARLRAPSGSRVLITGCGLGDDISAIYRMTGPSGEIYAQDISAEMIVSAQNKLKADCSGISTDSIYFSVSDAGKLPFPDNHFDGAYHFGGINLFSDVKGAIGELNRVVKPGGRVVFGDEGIGPWLRDTEYGKVAVNNIRIWGTEPPIALLPATCMDVNVSWILGNCFYLIDYQVSEDGPQMNIDIKHKGLRGGSARTRYYGQLEGVTPETRERVIVAAKAAGLSVHDWLERTLTKFL